MDPSQGMPRKDRPTLFEVKPPTLDEAWAKVARVPLDAPFDTYMKRCQDSCCTRGGGKGHGPYWGALVKRKMVHIGSEEAYQGVLAAHEVVRRELEAAERAGGATLRRYRELTARAYHKEIPGVVSVPVYESTKRAAAR